MNLLPRQNHLIYAYTDGGFGVSNGLTKMGNVDCDANMERLTDCGFIGYPTTGCTHNNDIGIRCGGMTCLWPAILWSGITC